MSARDIIIVSPALINRRVSGFGNRVGNRTLCHVYLERRRTSTKCQVDCDLNSDFETPVSTWQFLNARDEISQEWKRR